MHKKFYASGFFYYQPTQQILLQQHTSLPSIWFLFGGKNRTDEIPVSTFSRVALEELQLKIPSKSVYPVYDYFDTEKNMQCFIFCALIANIKKVHARDGYAIEWFTLKQVNRLGVSEQSKQDILIGKRVIDAVEREKQLLENPPPAPIQ